MEASTNETKTSPEEVDAAREVVASLEAAFNAHDPDAVSALYARESAWGTVMGKELGGRDEIASFARTVMPALAESYVRYEVTRTLRLAPGVIAVRVHQSPVTPDGTPADQPHGAALYVIARREGDWKIVAGQVTFVGAAA